MKVCTKCGIKKDNSEFGKAKHHSDGLSSHCKDCLTIVQKEWLKNNHKKQRERVAKYRKEHPWTNTYININRRCNDPKHKKFKWYGGKGIKNLLRVEELKELWFRDRAFEMKKPSIDRIDSNKNYTFDNCEYVELKLNQQRAKNDKNPNKRTRNKAR